MCQDFFALIDDEVKLLLKLTQSNQGSRDQRLEVVAKQIWWHIRAIQGAIFVAGGSHGNGKEVTLSTQEGWNHKRYNSRALTSSHGKAGTLCIRAVSLPQRLRDRLQPSPLLHVIHTPTLPPHNILRGNFYYLHQYTNMSEYFELLFYKGVYSLIISTFTFLFSNAIKLLFSSTESPIPHFLCWLLIWIHTGSIGIQWQYLTRDRKMERRSNWK